VMGDADHVQEAIDLIGDLFQPRDGG
jgi:hypothetical protein